MTSLQFVPPNTLEGEVTPSINFQRTTYKGWEIEAQIGYQVIIALHDNKPNLPPGLLNHDTLNKGLMLDGEAAVIGAGIRSLLIFVGRAILVAALA